MSNSCNGFAESICGHVVVVVFVLRNERETDASIFKSWSIESDVVDDVRNFPFGVSVSWARAKHGSSSDHNLPARKCLLAHWIMHPFRNSNARLSDSQHRGRDSTGRRSK